MSSRLITIASFAQPADAYVGRNQLERQGIPAVVVDATTATTLWHLSTATGGAKLQVNEADVARARAILLEHVSQQSDPDVSGFWRCGPCQEVVDPGFDVCWSCSRPRSEVEDPSFQPTLAAVAEPPIEPDDGSESTTPLQLMRPSPESRGEQQLNPYLPSGAAASAADSTPIVLAPASNLDEIVTRAWRAAILGLFVCPPLLNIYSMYLLLRVSFMPAEVSKRANRRFYVALLINILVGMAAGFYRWFEWLR